MFSIYITYATSIYTHSSRSDGFYYQNCNVVTIYKRRIIATQICDYFKVIFEVHVIIILFYFLVPITLFIIVFKQLKLLY